MLRYQSQLLQVFVALTFNDSIVFERIGLGGGFKKWLLLTRRTDPS